MDDLPGDPDTPVERVAASQDAVTGEPTASPLQMAPLVSAQEVDVEPPAGSFHTLDPRSIRAEQVGDLIFGAVLLFGGLIWMTFQLVMHGLTWFFWALLAATLLIAGLVMVLGVWWPYLTFRHTRWQLSETGLEIRKGVIWRHRIIVPLSRVQHADVSQGPLQRAFDLGTLTVHTAGTSNASVELAGLNHDVAVQVRDSIVRARSQNHVRS